MATWWEYTDQLHSLLRGMMVTDSRGAPVDAETALNTWRDLAVKLAAAQRTVYLIGNGASASMASHFAADLAKNARLHTQTFFDLSLLTAISNDLGYEHVFAEPLRRRAQAGDMLVAISSSGRSPNIMAAVNLARDLRLTIVTLSGMRQDNPLRTIGELNFYVSANTYGLAETAHAAILHHWMDLVQAARSVG